MWELADSEALKSFPDTDFLLHYDNMNQGKSGVVLGPLESDGKGGTKGTFAVYGDSSLIQGSSLSFSADGKLLAVCSTPNRVDIWNVESRTMLRSFTTGTTVALTADGHLLATDGNGIELWDVSSGKMQKRIPRTLTRPEGTVNNFVFNPAGTLLDVTVNGDDGRFVASRWGLQTFGRLEHKRLEHGTGPTKRTRLRSDNCRISRKGHRASRGAQSGAPSETEFGR